MDISLAVVDSNCLYRRLATGHLICLKNYLEVNETGEYRSEKLRQLMKEKCGKDEQSTTLKFTLALQLEDKAAPKADVTIEGELLEQFHNVIYFGNCEEKLKLRLSVLLNYGTSESGLYDTLAIEANDLQPDENSGGHQHNRYNQCDINILQKAGQWNLKGRRLGWMLWVSLDVDDFIPLRSDVLPSLLEQNRKILKERKFCDFKIVAGDGTVIPCHKIFLMQSPVFATMLETGAGESRPLFEEAVKNKMSLEEVSPEGVNALLEYLYCGMIAKPVKYASIALELFQVGHKYDLPSLEETMKTILLEKSCKWYDADTALKMYLFVRNYEVKGDHGLKLKEKAMQVLKGTADADIKSSKAFQQVFVNDVAMEVFLMALCDKK